MMNTSNVRFYGDAPYRVSVIHGGPGAPGSVAPVARGLAASGISAMEPLQTATTMQGQIDELAETIRPYAPLVLAGHSWGAWLAYLTAAAYPDLVSKLILISSGPFESHYAKEILPTRLARLAPEKREEADALVAAWENGTITDRQYAAFGAIMNAADTYCPIAEVDGPDPVACDGGAYSGVWDEADAIRRSGELLSRAARIRCPVTAIHGDYDPHPYRGVEEPLAKVLDDFRFILLEKCGHEPWAEQYARNHFFQVLQDEII